MKQQPIPLEILDNKMGNPNEDVDIEEADIFSDVKYVSKWDIESMNVKSCNFHIWYFQNNSKKLNSLAN